MGIFSSSPESNVERPSVSVLRSAWLVISTPDNGVRRIERALQSTASMVPAVAIENTPSDVARVDSLLAGMGTVVIQNAPPTQTTSAPNQDQTKAGEASPLDLGAIRGNLAAIYSKAQPKIVQASPLSDGFPSQPQGTAVPQFPIGMYNPNSGADDVQKAA